MAKLNTEIDDSHPLSSFRLTSFDTIYEDNDLIVSWSFDASSLFNDPMKIQFQIVIEQELFSRTEIIRRTNFISPFLKQYTLHHLPAKRNYQVCLLLTRTSYGTDKYCRETTGTSNQTVSQYLSVNRSILCGFLVGTLVTAGLLVIFAFTYHLHMKHTSRQKAKSSLADHHGRQRYMYIQRNEDDGTYSHSIVSLPSSKFPRLEEESSRTVCSANSIVVSSNVETSFSLLLPSSHPADHIAERIFRLQPCWCGERTNDIDLVDEQCQLG